MEQHTLMHSTCLKTLDLAKCSGHQFENSVVGYTSVDTESRPIKVSFKGELSELSTLAVHSLALLLSASAIPTHWCLLVRKQGPRSIRESFTGLSFWLVCILVLCFHNNHLLLKCILSKKTV